MILKRKNVERIAESERDIAKLKAMGFAPMESVETVNEQLEKTVFEMNVAELRKLAKGKGIDGAASLNKEELRAVLKGVG